MKKLLILTIALLPLCSCSILGSINWNPSSLASAAGKTMTAASITDEQVVALSRQTIANLDSQNALAPSSYSQRLARLMKGVTEINGMPLNFKVYKTDEINAFACGDGSVRVYSGLMDVMSDDELVAILGHELGHVSHQDTKRALKNAYLASAARDVVGSAGSVGALAANLFGDLGEALVSAQFSQSQEFQADEHGFQFAIDRGYGPNSMGNALQKLMSISDQGSSSVIAHMFASHPKTEKRIERVTKLAESYNAKSSK